MLDYIFILELLYFRVEGFERFFVVLGPDYVEHERDVGYRYE